MRQHAQCRRLTAGVVARSWLVAIVVAACVYVCGAGPAASAAGVPRGPDEPLHVAVYDVAPYGSVDAEGLFSGVSVDLWRRVAEDLHLTYRFTAVAQMDAVLGGLQSGQFDAAIGAITITPERLARVDFSYPAHRSGVAVAFARKSGPIAAVVSYGQIVGEHGSLIGVTLGLLVVASVLMWSFERRRRTVAADTPADAGSGGAAGGVAAAHHPTAVTSLLDGIYWAVVTMTTVGYGDKTPKTGSGRFLAVLWMLASLALISLVSSTLVSNMTAARLESGPLARDGDLAGKRLAAVASSSGAEYLDSQHLPYAKYATLDAAMAALADGKCDAIVNSVGALQYIIATRFFDVIAMPSGLLEPAYMAFALPPNSPLKKPLDRALVRVTASPGWRSLEDSYFSR